jgi:hypothetical protein
MTLVNFLLARIAESTEYWRARRVREIDRQSIDRVLAGLAAQQRIVELYGIGIPDTLRLLALPYADHLDYRDEWRAP